jgi:hypothetical protein
MEKVKMRIVPSWIRKIPAIRKGLPEELRICVEHKEEIIIREYDFQTGHTAGPPFEAELLRFSIGCDRVAAMLEPSSTIFRRD